VVITWVLGWVFQNQPLRSGLAHVPVRAKKEIYIFLLRPLGLFALWYHFFFDDHKLFLKMKKKETYLMS
jgi:hypothetical protein